MCVWGTPTSQKKKEKKKELLNCSYFVVNYLNNAANNWNESRNRSKELSKRLADNAHDRETSLALLLDATSTGPHTMTNSAKKQQQQKTCKYFTNDNITSKVGFLMVDRGHKKAIDRTACRTGMALQYSVWRHCCLM